MLQPGTAAQTEKDASADRGAAVRAQAEADADAEKIKSMAMRVRAESEAEAQRLMNWSRRPRRSSASRCGGWSAECEEGREREPTESIGSGVFHGGFDALKRHFGVSR